MKVVKIIYSLIQGLASIVFLYGLFCVTLLLGALFPDSPFFLMLQSFTLIFAILGVILFINSIIGMVCSNTLTIRIISIINVIVLLIFSCLINFNYDLTTALIILIIAAMNTIIGVNYEAN